MPSATVAAMVPISVQNGPPSTLDGGMVGGRFEQAPPTAPGDSPPDARFRVLPSGVLGLRLADTKAGKPVWLDVIHRIKLCEHGHSMSQMHHWRCAARPRAKPSWVRCNCDTKGLYTDIKAKPALPTNLQVPSYASVLWRDGTPKRLESFPVLAVRVPGNPKEREVWIDADGKARCAHGFTESVLTRRLRERKDRAASRLQHWWRMLGSIERASVRATMLHASASDYGLQRAAGTWRLCNKRWRAAELEATATRTQTQKRGRPSSKPCHCRPGGLRREIFGTLQRPQMQIKRMRSTSFNEDDRVPFIEKNP